MFARRAKRLRALVGGHELGAYLTFVADLSDDQHGVQSGLPSAELPAPDAIARARQFKMPPLDRQRFTRNAAFDALWEGLLATAGHIAMPDDARLALDRLKATDPASQGAMIGAVLANAAPVRRSPSTCLSLPHYRCTSPASQRGSMPKRWYRSVKALVRPAALRLCPPWWSVGVARMPRGFAPAHCAARFGIIRASNVCCAARRKASRTNKSRADRGRSKPKPAGPAVLTSR